MAKALTKKQKGFVKDYAKTGNGTQAVLKNYDTTDYATASVIAVENLEKPRIIKALAERLPDDLLEERHLELLNKRETHIYSTGRGKGYKVHKIDLGPEVQAVSKGLDMAYKIKGSYAPEKSQRLQVNLNGHSEDKSALEELRREYEEKLKAKLLHE